MNQTISCRNLARSANQECRARNRLKKRAIWRSLDCSIEEFEEIMGKDVFRIDSSCFCGRRKRDKKKKKEKAGSGKALNFAELSNSGRGVDEREEEH